MYYLTAKDVAGLRELIQWWETQQSRRGIRPSRREVPPMRLVLCKVKTAESLTSTASDSAVCIIQEGDPGSETDGQEITVYSGRLMVGGTTISAGDYIWAGWVNGKWQVFAAACG